MGSLYEELKVDHGSSLAHPIIYQARRFIWVLVSISLQDHACIQIQVLLFMNFMTLAYTIYTLPYKKTNSNRLEIFNESCILLTNYHLYLFTDFTPDSDLQYRVGWSVLGIFCTNIITNMIIVAF